MTTVGLYLPNDAAFDALRRWRSAQDQGWRRRRQPAELGPRAPAVRVKSIATAQSLRANVMRRAVDVVVVGDTLISRAEMTHWRQRQPAVRWVVVTAAPSYQWAEETLLAGAHAFLAVPCPVERLERLVAWLATAPPLAEGWPPTAAHAVPPTPSQLARPVETAIAYIESHLGERLSLDEVARYVYLSRSHFSRLFQRTVGRSFNDFVRARRLERAQALLRETRYPVEVIAAQLGFSSPAYFSSAFKRALGCSPAAYRRRAEKSCPTDSLPPASPAEPSRDSSESACGG